MPSHHLSNRRHDLPTCILARSSRGSPDVVGFCRQLLPDGSVDVLAEQRIAKLVRKLGGILRSRPDHYAACLGSDSIDAAQMKRVQPNNTR
jgi:hypothetical protein